MLPQNYYAILVDKKVVPVEHLSEIESQFKDPKNRSVEQTYIRHLGKTVLVSTVFLAINHGYQGTDHWFETLVFDGPLDGEMERYETFEQAQRGHYIIVRRVRRWLWFGWLIRFLRVLGLHKR